MTINHDDAERSRFDLNTCTPLALLTLEFANRSSVDLSSCDQAKQEVLLPLHIYRNTRHNKSTTNRSNGVRELQLTGGL